jgi:putative PIN family toxin of toxin-antitoxin system
VTLKAVFDTNIYISAFVIPGGKAEEAYLHAIRGAFTLYSSVAILTETAKKLRQKFGWPENEVIRLLKAITRVATVLRTRPHIHEISNEADNRILECALEAEADYIVTGDKHLLSRKQFQKIKILRLSEFLEFL